MKLATIILALTFSTPIIAAESLPEIVKKADLPADLRGARTIKVGPADGIPGCTTGRAKLSSDDDTVKAWASTHEKHVCASAGTVYVCRAGKNLSVRCE